MGRPKTNTLTDKKYKEYVWQRTNRFPHKPLLTKAEWIAQQLAKGVDPETDDCRVKSPNSLSRLRFSRHRAQAKYRDIPFEFTWEQWHQWWLDHGYDRNQPNGERGADRMCMCRYGDEGPYSPDNVYCASIAENNAHAAAAGKRRGGRPRGAKNRSKG